MYEFEGGESLSFWFNHKKKIIESNSNILEMKDVRGIFVIFVRILVSVMRMHKKVQRLFQTQRQLHSERRKNI